MTGSLASSTGSQLRVSSQRSARLRKLSILSSSASQPGPLELLRDELIASEAAEQVEGAELLHGGASSVSAGTPHVLDASGCGGSFILGQKHAHISSAGSSPVEGTGRDSSAFSQHWGSDISVAHCPLPDHVPAPRGVQTEGARPTPEADITSSAAVLAAEPQLTGDDSSYDDGRLRTTVSSLLYYSGTIP